MPLRVRKRKLPAAIEQRVVDLGATHSFLAQDVEDDELGSLGDSVRRVGEKLNEQQSSLREINDRLARLEALLERRAAS